MMEALEESTMTLSDDELQWAYAVKDAAQQAARDDDTNIVELSDYEYCQYALFTKGDTEDALKRMEMMQYFREEYQIHDTPEEGMEILLQLTHQLQPWFMVSVDYTPSPGHFVVVYDYAKLNPSAVRLPDDWRVWLGSIYYLYQLLTCNLLAIREGLVHICECESMWKENFSVDFMSQLWSHLMEHYPLINKECSWLHTPLVGNLQHSFYKKMMGSYADVIRVGCDFEGYDGRVDEMFKTPSIEEAERRLLSRYMSYLRIRYHHQAVFKLPDRNGGTATRPDPPARLLASHSDDDEGEEDNMET